MGHNRRLLDLLFFGLLALSVFVAGLPARAAESPVGTWVTGTGSQVKISSCGKGYCGYISKIVVPAHFKKAAAGGARFTDALNKDPGLRHRPIMGLHILTLEGKPVSGKYKGRIYNPEDGSTYSGNLQILAPGKVKVTGCAMRVLCRGESWTLAKR